MLLKLKLALGNVKGHKKTFLPFLFSGLMTFLVLSAINQLKNNPALTLIRGGNSLSVLIDIGIPIFMFFFLLLFINVNLFTYKFRSKNYGLYHVLGFSKKDIIQVYLLEIGCLFLLSVVIGSLGSLVFDRLMMEVFKQLIQLEIGLKVQFSVLSLLETSLMLLALFGLSSAFVVFKIIRSSSLTLLHENEQGETPPSYNLVFAVVGILFLIGTYLFAITIEADFMHSENIIKLFLCILSAIMATYLIFMSSSVFLLDKLRKNKRLYYRPKAIVILSNLYFRMKKNAFGLASVTVLSTMAIFTMAVSVILFLNLYQELPLEKQDVILETRIMSEEASLSYAQKVNLLEEDVDQLVEQKIDLFENTTLKQVGDITLSWIVNTSYEPNKDFYFLNRDNINVMEYYEISLMPLSLYNSINQSKFILSDHQVMFIGYANMEQLQRVKIYDEMYTLVRMLDKTEVLTSFYSPTLVFDDSIYEGIISEFESKSDTTSQLLFPTNYRQYQIFKDGERISESDYYDLKRHVNDQYHPFQDENDFLYNHQGMINFTRFDRENIRMTFSSLLLVGFIFIIIFLLNLFSTLYFKYYQEALQDKKQFKTLQNVGLSAKEAKQTLTLQISLIFFLPLIFSMMHIYFARKGIYLIQKMFSVEAVYGYTSLSALDDFRRVLSLGTTILFFVAVYVVMFFIIRKITFKLIRSNYEIQ